MPETRERWRFRLPHWELADATHFVTVRCAGSLPAEALYRIREVHESLQQTEPASPQFAALQRKYFLICERFLDAGYGPCPFRERTICELTKTTLSDLGTRNGWRVPHFTLMPNRVHLLLVPEDGAESLKNTLRGWKWYVAREANRLLQRRGSFWQTDWFDRWARTEAETLRMRDYVRQNPVKAGLAARWEDYLWTRSEPDPDGEAKA